MISSAPYLEALALEKRYGKRKVLEGLSYSFPLGLTIVKGPSGAGKSTLLRLLATAEKASKGDLLWKGVALPRARRAIRSCLGYAPQSVDLPEDLTAREFGAYMSALKGLDGMTSDRQFSLILEALGLLGEVDLRIGGFSGGMRRRLILAQALLGKPELLVLDEPTAELDSETARKVLAILRPHMEQAVVVITTHADQEFRPYALGQVTIQAGRLTAA